MGEEELQRLLEQKRIEEAEPDPVTAREEITTARTHIVAAQQIAALDPALAFTGLYDAIRKSIQAHMRANGYRITKGLGGHMKTGEYAVAALDMLDVEDHLDEFESLRIARNQSEYHAVFISQDDVVEAVAHADAIVEAVARTLGM
jgi:hypothetical protein